MSLQSLNFPSSTSSVILQLSIAKSLSTKSIYSPCDRHRKISIPSPVRITTTNIIYPNFHIQLMETNSGSSCRGSHNKCNGTGKQQIIDSSYGGIDYISNLPEAIILYILSFLPLKEWIVLSLASKRWKYIWTKISDLNLDEMEIASSIAQKAVSCSLCGSFTSPNCSYPCLYDLLCAARRKFVEFVDRMLLLHSGCTINTLRLYFFHDIQDGYTKRIDTWVRYALNSNIKELELDFSDTEHFKFFDDQGLVMRCTNPPQEYELPDGFFAPKVLKTFALTFCKFRASSFKAFGSLQSLHLKQLEVLDGSIAEIASKCPVLEDLIMEYCVIPDGFFVSEVDIMIKQLSMIHCASNEMLHVDISTPNLLMLTIVGKYLSSASIRKATRLTNALISISTISAHNADGDALNSLLRGLSYCQSLTLSTWNIQVIPVESTLLQWLHLPLQNLKHLSLIVGISKKELPRLSCLLMSCPNLESLAVILSGPLFLSQENVELDLPTPTVYNIEEETYWESQTQSFHFLKTSLKELAIIGLTGTRNEMPMITFLLKNAIVLKKLAISLCVPDKYFSGNLDEFINIRRNLDQMFNFIRESIQAEVGVDVEPFPYSVHRNHEVP